MASDPYPATDNRIFVYNTTGYGVPGMPLQSVTATAVTSIFVDPTENFLYAVHMGSHITRKLTLPWSIYRYEVNPTNGELADRLNEATYLLPDQDTEDCFLSIAGMNTKGTKIFDNESCGTHEGDIRFYHERTVDPQTGALGAPGQIFTWSIDTDATDSVQIIKGLLFAFSYPVLGQPFNGTQVYPITANMNANPTAALSTGGSVTEPTTVYILPA